MSFISTLLPLLLGPILARLPFSALALKLFLHDYLPLLLLFCCWALAARNVQSLAGMPIEPDSGRMRRRLKSLLLVLTAFILLLSLQALRQGISLEGFYLALALLGAGALGMLAAQKGWIAARIGLGFLYSSGLGVLSLFVGTGEWRWQAVLAGASLACMLQTVEIARLLSSGQVAPNGSRLLARMYQIMAYLGPALMAGLPVFNELQQSYLLVLLVLPFSLPLATRFSSIGEAAQLPENTARESAGVSLLFMLMLLIARIL